MCAQIASRLLSASQGLVRGAAYTTGGVVDVGQPTPQSHPEVVFPSFTEIHAITGVAAAAAKFCRHIGMLMSRSHFVSVDT
jgi:putative hemolysin